MGNAQMVVLLTSRMEARVGLLADITESLAEQGVNISAICAYEMDGQGDFMLVADDPGKARSVLEGMGADVAQDSAIAVTMDDEPGKLASAARAIAGAGVNIEYVFASACGCASAMVVFKTSDDEAAMGALG